MEFNYATIKQLAKDTGRRVSDLIALASQNDPFYVGTPSDWKQGEWFAGFYHNNYAPGTRVHLRRCHYKVLSLELMLPDGKPYLNTDASWDTLNAASKAARYLGLVDVDLIEDKKNVEAQIFDYSYAVEPEINVSSVPDSDDLQLPDFPDMPSYSVDYYRGTQPYRLELWIEKSTMNDVLIPLCELYKLTLQTGAGELSITATRALARRIEQADKPTRILYISDYDPAGQSMPVAVARKLEYFVRSEQLDVDVRLFPAVLTASQCQQYNLPRTPIKESEKRKDSFEARHGAGATELDALEALRPGELQRILRGYIESYYDVTLNQRVQQARLELERNLHSIQQEVIERYKDQIEQARQQRAELRNDPRMQAYTDHVRQLWQDMRDDMQASALDLDEYAVPDPRQAREIGPGLYSSERSYLDQIDYYKHFQGKERG